MGIHYIKKAKMLWQQPLLLWVHVLALALASMLGWPYPAFAGVTLYVATNGADIAANGLSWDTPLRTISNALARTDGVLTNIVVVSNGTYVVSTKLSVTKGITLRSLTGNPADVTINGNYPTTSNTCIVVNHTSAVVRGFTFTKGYGTGADNAGGGVYLASGELNTCIIQSNYSKYRGGGLGVNIGTVRNCTIANNTAELCGGGIALVGGACSVWNSVIVGNRGSYENGGGVGFYYNSGTGVFYNCLIVSNYVADGGAGGGVSFYYAYGSMVNCTIVSNFATGTAGGARCNAAYLSTFRNCIIYGNSSSNASYLDIQLSGSGYSFTNCCVGNAGTYPTLSGTNNLRVDPQYVNNGAGNFRLKQDSPCINAGINDAWMEGATDLDGHSRIDRYSGRVDMGVYEYLNKGILLSLD